MLMFQLYLIADRDLFASDEAWLDTIASVAPAVAGDERVGLQVRIKSHTGVAKHRLAAAARARLVGSDDRVLLNGTRAEAMRAGYFGVHWPEDAIPAPDGKLFSVMISALSWMFAISRMRSRI